MNRLLGLLFFIAAFAGAAVGQSYADVVAKVREIKLLESTRDDVQRILADYVRSESNDHDQRYYNENLDIKVHFSSGKCSDDPDDDDDSVVWKVSEWKVTRIEVEPDESIAVEDTGFDLSKLMKEQMYRESPDQQIHSDKARGLAIETDEGRIETIIFFPPRSQSKKLCQGSAVAKEFYSRESWFGTKLEDRTVCGFINQHANVEDMILSETKIEATTNKTISVTTIAVDPENDVLTYNYTITAGQIRGTGSKVTWDLMGVPAGTYSITVGVDDGAGIVGKTITKTITVK